MSAKQPRAIEKKSPIEELMGKKIQIITSDGRVFIGILKGIDQTLNTILSECEERIYSKESPLQIEKMGLQMLRGDTIVMAGELDEETDSQLNFETLKAEPLDALVN